MTAVKKYLSLIKFSHTIFAMPFALIGFVMGWMEISKDSDFSDVWLDNKLTYKLLLVIGCMVFARSAAMAFNRYLDRHIDALNPRTIIREIPAGIIKPSHALLFTIASCVLFVATTFFINRLCFYLSFVALFVVLFYSYTKRFTALCHLVLGLGLSLAPIGAYIAVTGKFDVLPVLFSLIVITWVSGFDIIYSLQDEEFDKSNRLHSIPALMGKRNALVLSIVLHLIAALIIIIAGWFYIGSAWYWVGALIFIGMLIYQHSIVTPGDLSRVNLAFMTANGIASLVFSVFVITGLLTH